MDKSHITWVTEPDENGWRYSLRWHSKGAVVWAIHRHDGSIYRTSDVAFEDPIEAANSAQAHEEFIRCLTEAAKRGQSTH